MARRKKKSASLLKAESRLVGIKSINTKLDMGSGMSATAYEKEIVALRQKITAYNTTLAQLDARSNEIIDAEKQLFTLSERMLLGVAMKYGKDSSEYEMAGGTRRSEHRRRRANQPVAAVAAV